VTSSVAVFEAKYGLNQRLC